MLEKLFGKRSTGIVWIVTASILLLLLAGFVASYLLSETIDLYSLVGYAVFIGFALILITLPAFVQKKFKLYIPPFIQTGLCVYALLYLVNDLLPSPETNGEFALVQINFLPAVGRRTVKKRTPQGALFITGSLRYRTLREQRKFALGSKRVRREFDRLAVPRDDERERIADAHVEQQCGEHVHTRERLFHNHLLNYRTVLLLNITCNLGGDERIVDVQPHLCPDARRRAHDDGLLDIHFAR